MKNHDELRDYRPVVLKLSINHPGRRRPGPPIIAGPDPVADIDALVLEIYRYIYAN